MLKMKKLKKLISKLYRSFNSTTFIRILLIISWVLFITAVISTVFIVFNEELKFSPNSNGFNSAFDIFKFPLTILASLIAIISLRIALIRVTQTDKQLESSYKPELFVSDGRLYFYTRAHDDYENKFVFTTSGAFNELPKLRILNVGLAVAKKIKHHYEYDIETALKLLKAMDEENEFTLNFSDDLLRIRSGKTNYKDADHYVNTQNRERVSNFLLPTLDKNISHEVNLPLYYCELFVLYLYLDLKSHIREKDKKISKENIHTSIFPKIKLIVSYKDLGGKFLVKTFEIGFIVPFFSLPIVNGVFMDTDNEFLIEAEEVI